MPNFSNCFSLPLKHTDVGGGTFKQVKLQPCHLTNWAQVFMFIFNIFHIHYLQNITVYQLYQLQTQCWLGPQIVYCGLKVWHCQTCQNNLHILQTSFIIYQAKQLGFQSLWYRATSRLGCLLLIINSCIFDGLTKGQSDMDTLMLQRSTKHKDRVKRQCQMEKLLETETAATHVHIYLSLLLYMLFFS